MTDNRKIEQILKNVKEKETEEAYINRMNKKINGLNQELEAEIKRINQGMDELHTKLSKTEANVSQKGLFGNEKTPLISKHYSINSYYDSGPRPSPHSRK